MKPIDAETKLLAWRQNLIAKIAVARTAKGITQTQLAEMLGTNRSNISRLESGAHNPSLDFLLKVAAVLNLELDLKPGEEHEEIVPMNDEYEVRLYDQCLFTFTLTQKGIEGLVAEIGDTKNGAEKLLPIDLQPTNEGVVKWLERRVIPKNRTFVEEILKTLGIAVNDTKGIIDVCKGLSLNDSYWVVPKGFAGKFSEYNLYENRFSEILSLVAYTGIGQTHGAFSTSPELTTNGMLPKGWRFIENDGIYLYKGGTAGYANAGKEPYSEFYACQVANAMGLDAVQYDLENWKGILASKCKLFTDIDTAFVPIGRIVREGGLKAVLEYSDTLGQEFTESIKSMLVLDAVIYNEDRHFGNFGVLRDNKSGKILRPAPLFDHGLSLFCFAMDNDLANIVEYAKTRTTPYSGVSFESIVADVCGKTQATQLRRLIGFKFARHPTINLPEKRLAVIERHLQLRVRQLLEIHRQAELPVRKRTEKER
ncbi:MAG: helix-turn-helix domain-containing protein [Lachnospiraceae bacterium]|jgi:transcriptional regulator with XRE-family HTH domain|nr:helix-turn-helix domain-containing protein [Lachnospiraceae bacterium]